MSDSTFHGLRPQGNAAALLALSIGLRIELRTSVFDICVSGVPIRHEQKSRRRAEPRGEIILKACCQRT